MKKQEALPSRQVGERRFKRMDPGVHGGEKINFGQTHGGSLKLGGCTLAVNIDRTLIPSDFGGRRKGVRRERRAGRQHSSTYQRAGCYPIPVVLLRM